MDFLSVSGKKMAIKKGGKAKVLPLFLLLILVFSGRAQAAVRYVNGSCANNGDGTVSNCAASEGGVGAHNSVQAAINAASGADEVKIIPYSYSYPGSRVKTVYNENLIVTKEITLEVDTSFINAQDLPPVSSLSPAIWLVVDGDADDDGIGDDGHATLVWSAGVGGTLQNMTLKGGHSGIEGNLGAGLVIAGEGTDILAQGLIIVESSNGIAVRYGASPTIKSCFIYNNDKSGIVVRDGSSPIIGGGNCGGNPKTCNDSAVNYIYRNSMQMDSSVCFASSGYSDCEQARDEGCAAIAVLDASSPDIWGNKIYGNKYTGIVSMGQSTPSVKFNQINSNGRVGLGLLSSGQGIEVIGNWIQQNERGIGVQSSGDPCSKIEIKDNDILGNILGGISSCNAYLKIGGAAGDGNRIFNNRGDGIYIALDSEADISYNNLLNNFLSGIILFGSSGTVEKNLISDNGKFQNTSQFGQVELWAGTAEKINNNIIVGGEKTGSGFNGIGIYARETMLYPDKGSQLKQVRDNIIYRVGAGIKLNGSRTESLYRAGAVDRNLLMQWSEADADGYVLGECPPGDETYYYGQETGSYGNPPAYFFQDPDHENSGLHPDFLLVPDANSPVYTISAYAGSPPADYLGLPADFEYKDDTEHYKYKFMDTLTGLVPSLDSSAPLIGKVIPPDGASGSSVDQIITVTLWDTGDGIDTGSLQLDLDGGVGASGNCSDCAITTSGNSSNLRLRHEPSLSLDSGTSYTITVTADDVRSNQLVDSSVFSTNGSENDIPYLEELTPADEASEVAADTAIQFKLRDDGSGINPETITLEVDGGGVSPEKNQLSDGVGVNPDYLVYYKPGGAFSAGSSVDLRIYAQDYDSNIIDTNSSFDVAANTSAPEDVSKLTAQVKGPNSIKLSWIPSENTECDIATYPYTLYTDSGNGYDSGQALSTLAAGSNTYLIQNLSEGTYIFKLTVKDTENNESVGAVISNAVLSTSSEFGDDFNGLRDDFSGDLSQWDSAGPATWQIMGGELQVSGETSELTMLNLSRSDYRYQLKLKITGGTVDQDAAWILVRKTAGSGIGTSGYAARIGLGLDSNIGLYELSQTGSSVIGTASNMISLGSWYNIKLEVEANTIALYINDSLKLTVSDSDYTYQSGLIGLWQPFGTNAAVSFDDVQLDYNKSSGGLYRYSVTENSWIHTLSGGTLYTGDSATDRELLVNPLNLADNFLYKIKLKIGSGYAGLLVRKTLNGAVGGSGYRLQIEPGATGNIKFYALPGTLLASGDYSVSLDTDYWVWLVQQNGTYKVNLGTGDDYSASSQVISQADSTYADNATAGLYAFASSQVNYDDLSINEDLSESGELINISATPDTGDLEYSTIQSAINGAQPGDTVVFSSGTYRLGGNSVKMKEGVSLKAKTINGCGAKTVTITGSAHLIDAASAASIEGLRLEGTILNVGIWVIDASPSINNNEIVSCYDGIRVGGGASALGLLSAPYIYGNCIHDNAHIGIANGFESTAIIEENRIYNNYGYGVGSQMQAAPLIRGNRIYENSDMGIANQGDSYAIISQENLIYSNTGQGIGVRDNAYPRIENNHIYKNQSDGIGVGCDESVNGDCISTATPVIQNNIIYSNLHSGIAMRSHTGATVSSNEIYNHIYTCIGVGCVDSDHSFGAGIRFSEDAQPVLGANNIHDNSYGISMNLNASNSLTISGLSITQNGIGLHIGGNSAVTVENCTLYSNYKLGMGLYHTAHPTISNNEIRHNGDAAGRGGDNLRFMSGAGTGVGGIGLAVESYPTINGNNRIWGHMQEVLLEDDTLDTQSGLNPDEVRLGALASTEPDYYKGRSIYLFTADGSPAYNGNGNPQVVNVVSYNGSTKVATVSPAYIFKPNQNEHYRISRENYGIGIRGCKRNDGGACGDEALDAPDIPKIYNNQIYSNTYGIAVGSRDSATDAPNPEIYNNTISSNGCVSCPTDFVFGGGGIGNRAASAAYIHNNTVRNSKNMNNFGIGVREAASPTIHDNDVYSNRLGIGVFLATSAADVTITSNYVLDNGLYVVDRMRAGGIGMFRLAGKVSIDDNIIASNNGSGPAAGGIGIRELNGGMVNIGTTTGNIIRFNVGGQEAGELRCGGIGGRYDPGVGGTVTISNNQIYSNNNCGIGLDDFENTTFNISDNNQIHHNDKGVRIRNASDVTVSNNTIYSNGDGTQPESGVTLPDSGIMIRRADAGHPAMDVTITSNTVRANNGTGINSADLKSGDTVIVRNNTIGGAGASLGNYFGGISIGLYAEASNLGTYTIDSNYIGYNQRSGISFTRASDVDITDNDIISNGQSYYVDGDGLWDASGIRGKEATFGTVTGNTIRSNLFAGISSYTTDGYVGPNNTITFNGSSTSGSGGGGPGEDCPSGMGLGSGDGGVAVRDLDSGDILNINGNTITDNKIGTVTRKDCVGTVKLDGEDVDCGTGGGGGFWDKTNAKVYIDKSGIYINAASSPRTTVLTLDCDDTLFSDLASGVTGGSVWGVAIVGKAQGVIVKNCEIYNNNPTCNSYGPGESNIGGGLLVGPDVDAQIYSNEMYNNGCEIGPPSSAEGGSAGIAMYCNSTSTIVRDNYVHQNKIEGIKLRDAGGTIGVLGHPNTITTNGRHGIGSAASTNVTIQYNVIHGHQAAYGGQHGSLDGAGVACKDESSPLVQYNTITNNTNGIGIGHATADYPYSGSAVITNNTIDNNNFNSVGMWHVTTGADITITSNTMTNNNQRGVGFWDNDGGTVTIRSNPDISGHADGIGVQGSSGMNILVDNNVFTGLSDKCFGAEFNTGNIDFTITNNNMDGGNNGVAMRNNDGPGSVIIEFNTIENAAVGGIQFDDNVDTIVVPYMTSLTINSNEIYNSGDQGIKGHYNEFTGNIEITNNYIHSTSDAGISLRDNACSKIKFTGNTIDDGGGAGMLLDFANETITSIMIGNNVIGNHARSVEMEEATVTDLIIYSNTFSNNTDGAMTSRSFTSSAMIYRNNKFLNNDNSSGSHYPIQMHSNNFDTIEIHNNIFSNSTHYSFAIEEDVTDISITSNEFKGHTRSAVRFDGTKLSVSDTVLVSGNHIHDNGGTEGADMPAGIAFRFGSIASAIIANNTIEDNTGSYNYIFTTDTYQGGAGGIGIFDFRSLALYIRNNIIRNNTGTYGEPGGVGFNNSENVWVTDNDIYSNVATSIVPAGVGVTGPYAGSNYIERNRIYNNSGTGGIGMNSPSGGGTLYVRNNFVYKNAPYGIYCNQGPTITMEIHNNTIVSSSTGGIHKNTALAPANVSNCILWNNVDDLSAYSGGTPYTATYSNIENGDFGTGNFSVTPNFADAGSYDYHLTGVGYSVDNGSDVGLTDDIDGDTRPQNSPYYDVGADECGSCSYPQPDVETFFMRDDDQANSPDNEFTNNRTVRVTIDAGTGLDAPDYMRLSEDSTFGGGSDPFITFDSYSTFELSPGDETKYLYCQVMNKNVISDTVVDSITLDTDPPDVAGTCITRPAGEESWVPDNVEAVNWNTGDISDGYLKTNPVKLAYSVDGGAYTTITSNEANDGTYPWTVATADSSNVLMRLYAYDKAGNEGYDTSASFEIHPEFGGACSVPNVCPDESCCAEREPNCYPSVKAAVLAGATEICVDPGNYTDYGITINGTVSISSTSGSSITTLDAPYNATNRLFTVSAGGSLTLDGFTLEMQAHCVQGVIAYLNSGADLTVKNSRIQAADNNCGTIGGAFYAADDNTVLIQNCTAYDNEADGQGGVIAAYGSTTTVTIEDSIIDSNRGRTGGGSIRLGSGAKLNITGSKVMRGNSDSHGGEIYVDGGGLITLDNCVFSASDAGQWGNVMYLHNPAGDTVITSCEFKNMPAANTWGGVITHSSGGTTFQTISISDSKFINVQASQTGGALAIKGGTIEIDNTIFSYCRVGSTSGGAIYMSNTSSSSYIDRSTFKHSYGGMNGGAIYMGSADAKITNSLFYDNEATQRGGAIYITNSASDVEITNCTIVSSKVPNANWGSGIYGNSTNIVVTNSIICSSYHEDIRDDAYLGLDVNNSILETGCSQCAIGDNVIYTDPDFKDNPRFHLKSNSPGTNTGTDVTGSIPALDIDGESRPNDVWDMGADEFY